MSNNLSCEQLANCCSLILVALGCTCFFSQNMRICTVGIIKYESNTVHNLWNTERVNWFQTENKHKVLYCRDFVNINLSGKLQQPFCSCSITSLRQGKLSKNLKQFLYILCDDLCEAQWLTKICGVSELLVGEKWKGHGASHFWNIFNNWNKK